MASYIPLDNVISQFMDGADPAESFTIEGFLAGTSTPSNLFTDNAGGGGATSFTLDSNGYVATGGSPVGLFREANTNMKLVFKNAAASIVWTFDNIDTLFSNGLRVTIAGTEALPALVLGDGTDEDLNTGWRHSAADEWSFVAGATDMLKLNGTNATFTEEVIVLGTGTSTFAGPITATGKLLTVGDITLDSDNPEILGGDTNGVLTISPNTNALGGIIKQYGDTHATKAGDVEILSDTTVNVTFDTAGDVTLETGNLVMGTSGKGIDFSATSDAAGATSELLDDYEEGTWDPTPADAASGGNTSAAGTGLYTKIGRWVELEIFIDNIDTTGMTAGNDFFLQGNPFTVNANVHALGAITAIGVTFTGYLSSFILGGNTSMRLNETASGAGEDFVIVSQIADDSSDIRARIGFSI